MTGRIVFIPAQPHACDHPADGSHPAWTRWDCDDCGDRWIMHPGLPGEFSAHWARWPHDKPVKPVKPVQKAPWFWPWQRPKERQIEQEGMPQPDPDLEDPGIPERRPRW